MSQNNTLTTRLIVFGAQFILVVFNWCGSIWITYNFLLFIFIFFNSNFKYNK
jgi:hypothetical protein